MRRALKERFPLAQDIPLPDETKGAADFVSDSPPHSVADFWDSQLDKLDALKSALLPHQKQWDAAIHPAIKPAAGKIQTLLIRELAEQCGLGGSKWLGQFAVGFPITGTLSQKGVYSLDEPNAKAIGPAVLFRTAASRFQERAAKSGHKNATQLWEEAHQQVKKGWLNPPVELREDGRPTGMQAGRYNIAFRFGVEQASKLRACDDLRHSLTNSACSVRTPIQLVSWDHLAQLCRLSCGKSRDWALIKADHEAAYKQLPLRPDDQARAIIALRCPVTGKWFGFVSRTLVFGATAAVLHYNVFSRLITALANRLLGIPLICFFDDFAALVPRLLSNKALAVFSRFCEIMGITLKPGKSEVGPKITFLGLLGWFPTAENNYTLHISLPEEKRQAWSALLADFISKRSLSHQELEKLIGRLSFSQTLLFGKFARTQLRPLYQKLHRRVYNARLTASELAVFQWWERVIRSFSPRICTPCKEFCDWIVYTDAATSPPRLCALRFAGNTRPTRLIQQLSSSAPTVWQYLFRKTCLIFGLELLALVAFLEESAVNLAGCSIWFYMDSNNSLSAMTRGDSNTAVIAVLVSRAWELIQRFQIRAWFSRVPSKLNPADLPTRGKKLPFRNGTKRPFTHLTILFRKCRLAAEPPNKVAGCRITGRKPAQLKRRRDRK